MATRDIRKTAMRLSLAASAVTLIGKLWAYHLTQSAAVFSDLSESLVHGFATGMAAFSLWYSEQPADSRYQYGHGKIVYFSAGFEGALILLTGVVVLYNSTRVFIVGPELHSIGWGLAITAALAVFSLALGLFLTHVGRKHNALVITANGKHVLSDMWISVGALVGLGLVWITGIRWLDPGAGLLIGAHILYTGIGLVREAYFGLMDRADPRCTERLIACLNSAIKEHDLVGFHQLRHRQTNTELWVEVHLLVPGTMPTAAAHHIATDVEGRIRDSLAENTVWVTTHVEPADHRHPDGHEAVDAVGRG